MATECQLQLLDTDRMWHGPRTRASPADQSLFEVDVKLDMGRLDSANGCDRLPSFAAPCYGGGPLFFLFLVQKLRNAPHCVMEKYSASLRNEGISPGNAWMLHKIQPGQMPKKCHRIRAEKDEGREKFESADYLKRVRFGHY